MFAFGRFIVMLSIKIKYFKVIFYYFDPGFPKSSSLP